MAVVGRRPGNPRTRDDIVAAAGAEFTAEGYERASIRSIARRAGVDPSLVYHYFDGKAALFIALLAIARDPREIMEDAAAGEGPRGARVVAGFLDAWERGASPPGSRFVTAMQAVCSTPEAADGLREFMMERVWSRPEAAGGTGGDIRRSLVASQLMGVAWVRYVLRLEPLASAPIEQVAAWVGPTIDRYIADPLLRTRRSG